jgi:hypothetical protein
MGDTAHIDSIFKFLPHKHQHGCIDILHCCNDPCLKAVKNIDAPMLMRVWQEVEHHIDVCRVTRGAHIVLLYLSKKSFSVFLWL